MAQTGGEYEDHSPTRRDAIGGYFELELPPASGELYSNARCYQSARSAFLALVMALRPKRIWMPWYICESMLEAPEVTGVQVLRYQIDQRFEIASDIELRPDDWLLYVNYFGVCEAQVDRLLNRFPRGQIVIDNSQALFCPPSDCLATIYSPRKFFGIPDGGYLITSRDIAVPEEQDAGSVDRCEPLLVRLDRGAEAGYQSMIGARATLRGQPPKRMSNLTRRLLAHIDYAGARARRHRNYARYHRLLGARNQLQLPDAAQYAPLCYPLWNHRADIHSRLAERRIYVPKYWPNVRGESGTSSDLEYRLATECLALPCDQRYGDDEIDYVVAMLHEAIAG